MKHAKRLYIVAILLFVSVSGFCQSTESPCWKTAMAQSEMNRGADLDARKADSELNAVYNQLLSKLKSDQNATKKLRIAQRAWIAFRDAQLHALFPAENKQTEYGTMFPLCYSQEATTMTKERTAQLRKMLNNDGRC